MRNISKLPPVVASMSRVGWIFCFVFIFFCQSAIARDTNPPIVQALIGMNIPPQIPNKEPGNIPDFYEIDGRLLYSAPEIKISVGIPTLEVGYVENIPAFIVSRLLKDKTLVILDAQALPINSLDVHLVNGKATTNKKGYRFSENCVQTNIPAKKGEPVWLFGLVKPEPGKHNCTHHSSRVFKAWRVNQRSGEIEEISTAKMQCNYFTMDDCY